MRLLRYERNGELGVGAAVDGGVVATRWSSFDELFAESDPLAAAQALSLDESAAFEPDRLLPPLVDRAQIVGTGGNYADHAAEAKETIQVSEPVFMAVLWSSIIGPDDAIVIPSEDTQTDYEVELSVVIGKTARGLTRENAMDYVFGYTVMNDVSAREVMVRERFQIMLSKSPDTFTPVGPYVVTKDEIPDPHALDIASYLNGEIRQHSNTRNLTAQIPQLLEALTRTVTLQPGAIVSTGTPGGVGFFRQPQEFMKDGDTITAAVEGVGELSNRVVAGW
jgi:2-keto-4-pentenoate hydratase/2-oxohepta-3-ene-1,7-dioic acid hydratase in catechol pathway